MRPTTMPFLASGGASMPKCWRVSAGGRDPRLMFRRFVSAQTVVNDGDLRQRKISERDALVIGGKQNDVREHVANLADNLEQGLRPVRLPWFDPPLIEVLSVDRPN